MDGARKRTVGIEGKEGEVHVLVQMVLWRGTIAKQVCRGSWWVRCKESDAAVQANEKRNPGRCSEGCICPEFETESAPRAFSNDLSSAP